MQLYVCVTSIVANSVHYNDKVLHYFSPTRNQEESGAEQEQTSAGHACRDTQTVTGFLQTLQQNDGRLHAR